MPHVAPGVDVLDIDFELDGVSRTIHPVLLHDEETLFLVDAGFAGQLPLFKEAIAQAGHGIGNVDTILVTHHDRDHIGALPEFADLLGYRLEVLAHETERPYVDGELRFDKKALPGKGDTPVPPQDRPVSRRVTRSLKDGERLPEFGGIVVIHTPGHTPGHACYYLEKSQILVVGDALNAVDGELAGPNPIHTHDLDLALRSLARLGRYPVRGVACYHGGYVEGDPQERIAQLLRA
jgi:glyoxylase-like metal-dependent hydrolase (beta-lactamase superfamily II)